MILAGQTITWGLEVRDATGALADPGTGPTATVTRPDGTTGSGTVTKSATGKFVITFASTIEGRYVAHVVGSGANSGGFPYDFVADVTGTPARLIISLADARAALNLPATATANDSELLDYIAAATEIVEDLAGAQLSASVVQTFSGGGTSSLLLGQRATAVTQVVEDTVTLSASDYTLDTVAGILWRGSKPGSATWSAGASNITVTYTVGGTIAPNVTLAARELVRHLYSVGQQSTRPVFGTVADQSVDMGYTPSGFAVPARVIELLRPSMANRMPGIA